MSDLGRLEDLPAKYLAAIKPLLLQASAAVCLGIELLLPGAWAHSHRHPPHAVRMVVEGGGAWTTVDSEQCPMRRGDLILTPTGLWHEHGVALYARGGLLAGAGVRA